MGGGSAGEGSGATTVATGWEERRRALGRGPLGKDARWRLPSRWRVPWMRERERERERRGEGGSGAAAVHGGRQPAARNREMVGGG
jgi:hypothetical protein